MTQITPKGTTYDYLDGEDGWGASMNVNLRRLDAMALSAFAIDPTVISGLDLTVRGGPWLDPDTLAWSLIPDEDLTLADDDVSYIELDPVTGAITANLVGFTGTSVPIAVVTTAAGEVTEIIDWRGAGSSMSAALHGEVLQRIFFFPF